MASLDADREAKTFSTEAGKAHIYLYRHETYGAAIRMPVSLDGRIAGDTGPKTYFLWRVSPGKHEIASHTENTATLTIDAEAGRNYYVWQEVKMGMWAARSQLHEVDAERGQKDVNQCKLADSKIK